MIRMSLVLLLLLTALPVLAVDYEIDTKGAHAFAARHGERSEGG